MKFHSTIAIVVLTLAFTMPASAQMRAGEKAADISAIPGVIGAGMKWQLAWASPMTADGMTVALDGSLLFAQEQSNSIKKLWPNGREWVVVPYVAGAGAVSIDAQGRMFAIERTCTDPGLHLPNCAEPTRVTQLAPEHKVLADRFADGSTLGRLNDVQADGHGGAFFTEASKGGVDHVSANGKVTTIAVGKGLFTNGLALSPDGRTFYVTNRKEVLAFDVGPGESTSNRRTFATLDHEPQRGFGGDGMAVDSVGRLYVTGDAGIYVFDPTGKELGVIPVPRRAITLAFAGPGKRTLYIGTMGAVDPDGRPWTTPRGVRNVAMTIYKVPVLSMGP